MTDVEFFVNRFGTEKGAYPTTAVRIQCSATPELCTNIEQCRQPGEMM
jgi:hypothetical protein